jgi:hypothetical protein
VTDNVPLPPADLPPLFDDEPAPRGKKPNGHKANGKRTSKRPLRDVTGRPQLTLLPYREAEAANAAVQVLAKDAPEVYQRAGLLVRVLHEPEPSTDGPLTATPPKIALLPKPILRETLDGVLCLYAPNKRGDLEDVHPPGWFVELIDARGEWLGIRRLEMITQCPVLRPDGTVLDSPGYDFETGLLYEPNFTPLPLPEVPLREHALAAVEELRDIVCDFPFVHPQHEAGWLSLLLTPFARFAFRGPAPLGVLDGSVAGVGKGKLAQIISVLVDGCECSATPQPSEVEEERKLITSIAMAGQRFALIDNVTRSIGSGPLEALLTATRWRDRLLGANKTFDGDVLTQWFATGNNITFRKKDTIRRCVHVRVEANTANPEARSNWKHTPLLEWVKAERPRLVLAALTILRAHALAGYPNPCKAEWGSFEGWSARVRSAVVWLGLPDPADTRTELAAASDSEGNALIVILDAIRRAQALGQDGLSARDLLTQAKSDDELKDAIEEICPSRKAEITPRTLAYALRSLKGRVMDVDGRELRLDTTSDGNKAHSLLWTTTGP